MKLQNILVVYTIPTTKEYRETLHLVKKILKKHNIKYHLANRDLLNEIKFHRHDFVLAIGGDGTFLRAAQFIKSQLIFGVNADVKSKEGFFMKSSSRDFENKLRKIMDGKFKRVRTSNPNTVDIFSFIEGLNLRSAKFSPGGSVETISRLLDDDVAADLTQTGKSLALRGLKEWTEILRSRARFGYLSEGAWEEPDLPIAQDYLSEVEARREPAAVWPF